MTDCYSVHLIKLIVMTFHLFTYVASVFSDESNENTVTGGSTYPSYSSLFELFSGSPKSNLIPIDFSVLSTRKSITVAGRSLTIQPTRPHFNILLNAARRWLTT